MEINRELFDTSVDLWIVTDADSHSKNCDTSSDLIITDIGGILIPHLLRGDTTRLLNKTLKINNLVFWSHIYYNKWSGTTNRIAIPIRYSEASIHMICGRPDRKKTTLFDRLWERIHLTSQICEVAIPPQLSFKELNRWKGDLP